MSVSCGETKKTTIVKNPIEISGNYIITKFGKRLQKSDGLTLNFSSIDNSFSGNTGCNSFFGNYSLDLNGVLFNEIVISENYCDEALMMSEKILLSVLKETGTYSLQNKILTLYSKIDNSEILIAILESTYTN